MSVNEQVERVDRVDGRIYTATREAAIEYASGGEDPASVILPWDQLDPAGKMAFGRVATDVIVHLIMLTADVSAGCKARQS